MKADTRHPAGDFDLRVFQKVGQQSALAEIQQLRGHRFIVNVDDDNVVFGHGGDDSFRTALVGWARVVHGTRASSIPMRIILVSISCWSAVVRSRNKNATWRPSLLAGIARTCSRRPPFSKNSDSVRPTWMKAPESP